MRIGIDARTISEKGGCRTYVINLIDNLLKIDKNNQYIIFYNNKKFLGTFKNTEEHVVMPKTKYLQLVYDHISVPIMAKIYKLDIIHTPKSATSFFYKAFGIKNIVTVLDTIPLKFPETENLLNRLYWKLQIPIAIKLADEVITISKSAKDDIEEMFKCDTKIRVIYLGYNKNFRIVKNKNKLTIIKNKYCLPDHYILFVGTLQPRKNIASILRAFHYLIKNNYLNDYKLVICGRLGWMYDNIFKIIDKLDLKKHIVYLNFVSDEDLTYIYNLSDLFVFPSIYEGFGLPVLEAMACGVPVITSNISSLPEVAGEAGLKIPPTNIKSLALAIHKILKNKIIQKNMIRKGIIQANKFSWEKCARETLDVYKYLIDNKR